MIPRSISRRLRLLRCWEKRTASWMELSTWLSRSCLWRVRWIALTCVFCVPCVRKAAPCGQAHSPGRARFDWRWSNWSRKIRVAAHSASVSGDSVAYFSEGTTASQDVHEAVACPLSAEPTLPKPPCEAGGETMEMYVPSDEL